MNSQIPLVSVIIPTYNCASYLPQAIDSVISQTYQNWEMLVVDNNSSDNTQEIVKAYDDNRISIYSINNRGIIASSRNLGLKQCRGEWVSFLDADDFWENNKLQLCLEKAQQGYDVIYHPMSILRTRPIFHARKKTKSWQVNPPVFRDLLVRGNPVTNSSAFVNKSILAEAGNIVEDEALVTAEDYNTWINLAVLTDKFLYLDECLGTYRVHNSNTSETVDRTIPLENVISRHLQKIAPDDQEKALALLAYIRGKSKYERKLYPQAVQEFRSALACLGWPLVFPCALLLLAGHLKRLIP